ncbi:glutamate-5-semialdehyde dehydrogenase [Campylobacter suis]|uniref:Gamma-glutamyl phosphate reductase n=1 Tax=Campylobacter suis TaxID=2790657 RepID=A0ABM8Q812_9BACT|nr:glutamate-5-semialdehyde dehydrogenase [Campylobacter suis]CAD7289027.1 Gamma-glutamyl phosphate reductase [Campylobacter suis]
MSEILNLAKQANLAKQELKSLKTTCKNEILNAVANELMAKKEWIIKQNSKDIKAGLDSGLSEALLDRLRLNDARIATMAQGVAQVASLGDPIGEMLGGWKHQNGLSIQKVRVPLGVIGVIYESRPNVSIDVATLALKSQNAVILRGSASALHSNIALCELFNETGAKFGLPKGAVALLKDSERASVNEMIRLNGLIDVLIPRGGKGLKEFIVQNATIPVIETGAGVCHIFIDESASVSEAVKIIKNAKTQRPSVCNAVECVLMHEKIADKMMSELVGELSDVELRLDEKIYDNFSGHKNVKKAESSDFGAEFLDMILAVKVVSGLDEAINHINAHSSGHSDAILSKNYENVEKFLNAVDSAVVYANASTRFSDGGEFGFGGEIGISTQKLHARGPMGLRELTTYKYIVRGEGQVR